MEFCDILKQLRKSRGYTQEDLSKILEISAGAVGLYEQGRRNPDNDMLKKMSNIFGVSIDYLLGLRANVSTMSPSAPDISFDDFTYALYNETKELTGDILPCLKRQGLPLATQAVGSRSIVPVY